MKITASLSKLAGVALLSAGLLLAPAMGYSQDEGSQDLTNIMDQLQDNYRDLGRGLRDVSAETAPELLESVQKMQMLTVEAKPMVPESLKDMSGEEKEQKLKSYRLRMLETVDILNKMERALLNNEFDKTDALWDELKAEKDAGHEEFKID
jgi:soluble cytochrome b562